MSANPSGIYKGPCVECGDRCKPGQHRCDRCENEIEFPAVARDMLRTTLAANDAPMPVFETNDPEGDEAQMALWDSERWSVP